MAFLKSFLGTDQRINLRHWQAGKLSAMNVTPDILFVPITVD